MGRHKEWRKLAKKMRRKKIRQKLAQDRDEILRREEEKRESSPRYQAWRAEQNILEEFRQEEELRLQAERHRQWERDEELAQIRWKEYQEKLAKARAEKAKQELRIREEWELEQKKLKEAEEEKKKLEEEKLRKQEELMKEIDDFIKHGGELPPSVNISTETHPDKPLCPFFTKTGACRFGDHCSRNHPRPGISRVLLLTNFYTHFGLHQSMLDEYDTDLMLEYEDLETYQHFKEFYEDVLPEFELLGRVIQFKVCCNHEPHLRGNVYVQYESTRNAVLAFQTFHGRWYGGRQLNVEFTCVSSWKSAVCGLFFKRRCPKGRSCNFLHVFRNPGNAFSDNQYDRGPSRRQHRSKLRSGSPSFSPARNRSQRNRDDRRDWRWSESPEPPGNVNGDNKHNKSHKSSPEERNRGRSQDKKRKRDRGNGFRRSKSRNRNRSRSRSQSRSSRTSNSHRKSRRRKSRSRSGSN